MNCEWGDKLRTASDPWACDRPADHQVTVVAPPGNPIPALTLYLCDTHIEHAEEKAEAVGGSVRV